MPRRKHDAIDFKMLDKVRARGVGGAGVVVGFAAEYRGKVLFEGNNCRSIIEMMALIQASYANTNGVRLLMKCQIEGRGKLWRYPEHMDLAK